jgi:hypothetical protein
VQAHAEVLQLRSGYRPFFHPPSRVPYSWDMFAIRMDRCVVHWDPPLEIEGQRVASWHDRAYPIEFDTVYDRVRAYAGGALGACRYRTSTPTKVSLVCATADGRIERHQTYCP